MSLLHLDPASNSRAEVLEAGTASIKLGKASRTYSASTPTSANSSSSVGGRSGGTGGGSGSGVVLETVVRGGAGSAQLLRLHRASLSLLRVLFIQNPGHRVTGLMDLLPLFSQVYSARHPSKSYRLYNSSLPCLASSTPTGWVSMAFAALMTTLQSAASNFEDGGLAGLDTMSQSMPTVDDGQGDRHVSMGQGVGGGDEHRQECSAAVKQEAEQKGASSEFVGAAIRECRRGCAVVISELLKVISMYFLTRPCIFLKPIGEVFAHSRCF